jgi:hypothetical protein
MTWYCPGCRATGVTQSRPGSTPCLSSLVFWCRPPLPVGSCVRPSAGTARGGAEAIPAGSRSGAVRRLGSRTSLRLPRGARSVVVPCRRAERSAVRSRIVRGQPRVRFRATPATRRSFACSSVCSSHVVSGVWFVLSGGARARRRCRAHESPENGPCSC